MVSRLFRRREPPRPRRRGSINRYFVDAEFGVDPIAGDQGTPVRMGVGSYVHICRAISHTLSSLRLSSLMERTFPTMEEAKPHCGLSANRSSGTKRVACIMQRMRSSGRFHLRSLGTDQSEDHYLFIWDVP